MQTDSIFVHFPNASTREAIVLGKMVKQFGKNKKCQISTLIFDAAGKLETRWVICNHSATSTAVIYTFLSGCTNGHIALLQATNGAEVISLSDILQWCEVL
jgi:hypothetical protein